MIANSCKEEKTLAEEYMKKVIDGELFRKMVISGTASLYKNVKTVDDLNVFPIPDGDTGENMYLTMQGGLQRLGAVEGETLSRQSKEVASGMIMGARGNSGVILSQLFFGLSEGLSGRDEVDVKEFAVALKQGVKRAYSAVAVPVAEVKPVEIALVTEAIMLSETAAGTTIFFA
jgi:dihydroxyacetone kinase-like predicted kinase